MRVTEERDRFADALLRDDLRRLNSHLPKQRRSLENLLNDPSPRVPSVSGHVIKMRRSELEELSSALPEAARTRIRLPIVLLRRKDLGIGAFTILGDAYEEFCLALLAGSFSGTFEEFKTQTKGPVTIYKPQVSLLLRRFHSLFILGFGTADLSA